MRKIPSRKFSTGKRKIPSRKFSRYQRKLPSRAWPEGTTRIPSRKFQKALGAAAIEHVAQVRPDQMTKEAARQERLSALMERLKALRPASRL